MVPVSKSGSHAGERRKAERVRPGPLRVRVFRSEGSLIDISLSGAFVRLPRLEAVDAEVTLIVDWDEKALLLRARVVRSVPQRVQLANAVLKRIEYHVALQFVGLPPETVTTLRELLRR